MLVDVYLCHAPADREIAAMIANRLQHCAEAKVWLEPCGKNAQHTIAAAWDGGSAAAAIVLLLSDESIPKPLAREEWDPLLAHVAGHTDPPVGAVVLNACPYPRLLERGCFLTWNDGPDKALRELSRWVIGLHGKDPVFVPARLPWFEGRKHELELLWGELVDSAGMAVLQNPSPVSGKTSLAQEFAARASTHFLDVFWIGCGGRSRNSVAGEIASLFATAPENVDQALRDHRVLLVLDDVAGDVPIVPDADGRASVLITTRRRDLALPQNARVIDIQEFASGPVPELPTQGIDKALFEAMSACDTRAFDLELAASIAGVLLAEAREACKRLISAHLIAALDASARRFRFCTPPVPHPPRSAHANAVFAALSESHTRPERCFALWPEVEAAIDWALGSDWPVAAKLGMRAGSFLRDQKRLRQAADLYAHLRDAARARGDLQIADECAWELSWIEDGTGAIRPPSISAGQIAFNFL